MLELRSDTLARAVWIDFGDLDAELSDNALTLLPGETVRLHVRSETPPAKLREQLTIRTLADAAAGEASAPTSRPIARGK